MSEFLDILNANRLETVVIAIFLLFITRLLDFFMKLLYTSLSDKIRPSYREAKVEKIRKYLFQMLQLLMEQIVSSCGCCIRAYVIREHCDKGEFLASDNHPMYSAPKIFLDSLETFLSTGEISSTIKRYGTEKMIVKKLVLKGTYYFVIEMLENAEIGEIVKNNVVIVEFMIKLLDDFSTLLGETCDEYTKGTSKDL